MISEEFYEKGTKLVYWSGSFPYWSQDFSRYKKGDLAGYLQLGYRVIPVTVNGVMKLVRAHRLRWYMETGDLPPMLDHINRDRDDNDITNLRISNRRLNGYNRTKWGGNSKYKGVHFCGRDNRWRAIFKVDGVSRSFGYHETEEDAALTYDMAVLFHNLHDWVPMNFLTKEDWVYFNQELIENKKRALFL